MKNVVYEVLAKVFGVVLVLVGIGAIFGGMYAHGYVTDQLSQEKISMPTADGIKALPQASKDALTPFVGQTMTEGPQAQAYANNYIWEHMQTACAAVKDADGKELPAVPADKCTYAGIGTVANAATDAKAKAAYQALRTSNFQGDALRSMLLTAYAFWLIGSIALWVGIAALVVGIALLVWGFVLLPKKNATPAATA
jgi:hypothetical protein